MQTKCFGNYLIIGIEHQWCVRVAADVPVVGVELGSNINASYIREGMDVYFECSVTANPKVRKVTWLHNVSQPKYYLSQQLLVPFSSQKQV